MRLVYCERFCPLWNPSDYPDLRESAQIASNDGKAANATNNYHQGINDSSGLDYALVRNGKVSLNQIVSALDKYKQCYHPYFPLVCLALRPNRSAAFGLADRLDRFRRAL